MAKELFTDAQVDAEITRLLNSPAVKLAKKDEQIRNRKRQYMYCLRSLEKKGLVLAERGVTIESLLEEDRRIRDEEEGTVFCDD